MKIGITMRITKNETYPEVRDALSRDWAVYLGRLFPHSMLVPLINEPRRIVQYVKGLKLDALVLSNGNNWEEFPERDETEKKLVAYALKKNTPVLGVCRGFQALNVIFGGKIEKNIARRRTNHAGTQHSVILMKGPMRKFSKSTILKVNSYHRQGVTVSGVAKPLRIFAHTEDGVAEGFYHPTKPIVGIQWHPERRSPSHDFDRKLIRKLFKR